jgi:UDP-N-acetylmuramoyl-tripeptide--D-alanyl-D-alanine ligase
MLELGGHSAKLHSALAELITGTRTDMIFLAGPQMKFLAAAMPAEFPTEYRAGAEELKPILIDAIRPGDVVMVKSSKGIGFSKIVEALIRQFPDGAGNGQLS